VISHLTLRAILVPSAAGVPRLCGLRGALLLRGLLPFST